MPQFVILQIGLDGMIVRGPWRTHEDADDALDENQDKWQRGTDAFWVVEAEPAEEVDEPSLFD